ncbi:MAG: ATP-dependent helicase [Ardenticatenaceae bacterium]|nr:ATP-dependent helicase [Ardenticatenaceae bacterium]
MSSVKLTPQQEAISAHTDGPALVFAVAGAGKTTSILHRVQRLVRDKVFPAGRILTTSFGVGNVRDIKNGLQQWPACQKVDVRTLHSLGWEILRTARKQGLTQVNLQRDAGSIEEQTNRLYFRTLAVARQRQVDFKEELDTVDRTDFLDYVGRCKGNLAYADLAQADLPAAGKSIAGQAKPPVHLSWYLDLYRLFEAVRQEAQVITYDDMVMSGWELLIRHPELLSQLQNRYQAILVDEYQDINLAQSTLIDLIAKPHRNLMVVGDDDQTIYEWRGASPNFILGFAKRYQAQTYLIDENFRCPAGPLLMANRVIRHNRRRRAKELRLTKGFGGRISVRASSDPLQMGHDIAAEINRLRQNGVELDEIAVLVRLNGQTPPIEQALIHRNIPYQISLPFYERPEITALVQYIRLAWVENHMRSSQAITAAMGKSAAEAWRQIANRPKRYFKRELIDQISHQLRRLEQRPSLVLHRAAGKIRQEWRQSHLLELSDHLIWLSKQLERKASLTLKTLEVRLDYLRYLRENSGFIETGEARAAGVEAFLSYARQQGSTLELVQTLRQLAEERAAVTREKLPSLTISTIHQAKGLEWPVVFIPQCNDGLLPFQGPLSENPEEERRLMYVALTRSSRDLFVYYANDLPVSPYINESGWADVRQAFRFVSQHLAQSVTKWSQDDVIRFLVEVTELRLASFFLNWWRPPPEELAAARRLVQATFQDQPHKLKSCSPELLSFFVDGM